MKKLLLCVLVASACGGEEGGEELFTPKPECMGDAVTPFAGTFPQVISKLAIGSVEDGFDLDHDGKPDNKLAAVSSLAQSAIDDSFMNYDILIPIEFFDFPADRETVALGSFTRQCTVIQPASIVMDNGQNNHIVAATEVRRTAPP